mgnify:CR=1 FL=1
MYSEEMKKVMGFVRKEIALDRTNFNQLNYYKILNKADVKYKRTYMEGLISGAFVFSGIKLHEYTALKMYIAWEYRRLERIYF